eukprot:7233613-Prymnesium_polylepis.1
MCDAPATLLPVGQGTGVGTTNVLSGLAWLSVRPRDDDRSALRPRRPWQVSDDGVPARRPCWGPTVGT